MPNLPEIDMSRRAILFLLLAAGSALTRPAAAAEGPALVATVKPLHSLAAAVMDGVGEPVLLLQGAASPHTYALKPSDAQALARARLVVMVGEALESFMRKPLANRDKATEVLVAMDVPGVSLLPNREGGAFDGHDHGHAGHKHAHGGDKRHPARNAGGQSAERKDHQDRDAHLWLDPANARAVTLAIRDALVRLDPPNADRYRANAERRVARLDSLDGELAAKLAGLKGVPFIVFHDAYQYFEARYGLTAAGSITVSPERQPGARRLQQIRQRIATTNARCVFAEPQFEPALVRTVTEGSGVRAGTLDPIGADLPPGPMAYDGLMRKLAGDFIQCLK